MRRNKENIKQQYAPCFLDVSYIKHNLVLWFVSSCMLFFPSISLSEDAIIQIEEYDSYPYEIQQDTTEYIDNLYIDENDTYSQESNNENPDDNVDDIPDYRDTINRALEEILSETNDTTQVITDIYADTTTEPEQTHEPLHGKIRSRKWKVTGRGTVTYSDNLNSAPSGLNEKGIISSVDGSIEFKQNLPLAKIQGKYTGALDLYNDTGEYASRHLGKVEVSSKLARNKPFYLYSSAQIQTTNNDGTGLFDAFSTLSSPDERDTISYYTISPSVEPNLKWGQLQVRYEYSMQHTHNNSSLDSSHQTKNIHFATDKMNTLHTEIDITESNYKSNTYGNTNEITGYVSSKKQLRSDIAVTASVGYDSYDDDVGNSIRTWNGPMFNVGFVYEPTSRTYIDSRVGHQYKGFDYYLNALHKHSKTLYISAHIDRVVQPVEFEKADFDLFENRSVIVPDQYGNNTTLYRKDDWTSNNNPDINSDNATQYYTLHKNDAYIRDPLTGQSATYNNAGFAIRGGIALSQLRKLSIGGQLAHDTKYSASIAQEERQSAAAPQDDTETRSTIDFQVSRKISPQFTAGIGVYRTYSEDTNDKIKISKLSLITKYIINKNLSMFTKMTYKSNTFNNDEQNNYSETSVSTGLISEF